MRRLLSMTLVALLAGCGHVPAPVATAASLGTTMAREAELPVTAGGHRLGYDIVRGREEGRKSGERLPARQGLLPPRIDLREYCPPIYDQGTSGACTGFAIAKGLRELQQRQRKETSTPLSALFIYWMERYAHGTTGSDAGATVADGMTVLQSYGAAPDADWPYRMPQLTVRPTDQAFHDAASWRVGKTYHLTSLDEVKTSLARGYAVVMGFEVYRGFDNVGSNGWVPIPAAGEKAEGGHAVLVVGYDDPTGCLIVRNSWGTSWGASGYFFLPYAYASSAMVDEYWAAW